MSEESSGPGDGIEDQEQRQNPAESAIDSAEQALSNASEQVNGQSEEHNKPTPEEQAMLDMAKSAIGNVSGNDDPKPTPEEQSMLDVAKAAVGEVADTLSGSVNSVGSATPMNLPDLQSMADPKVPDEISILGDVNLNVKIELGRTRMLVEDILRLSAGAVVELDKLAGDPVDVIVNGRLVARGEVLVLNDSFCVRISEILSSTMSGPAIR